MSVLVTRLLLEWSEGFMSAIGVQRCCKASQDDAEMAGQTVHPEIAKLASLGSTGRQRSHATRDLLTWYLKNVYVAETTDIEIPVMDPGTSGVTWVTWPILEPHLLISTMAKHYPATFARLTQYVTAFWEEHDLGDPRLFEHPVLGKPRFKEFAVPVAVHADGGVWTHDDSLFVVSWGPLAQEGETWDWKFIATVIPKSIMCKGRHDGIDTLEFISLALNHSWQAAFDGVYPHRNYLGEAWDEDSWEAQVQGQALCMGYFLVLMNICGDLDFYSNDIRLPHFNSNAPCWLCRAGRGAEHPAMNIFDFKPDAGWRGTLAQAPTPMPSDHPFLAGVGVSVFHIACDWMHNVYLGVLQHVVGSVLFTIVFPDRHTSAAAAARTLSEVWAVIRSEYGRLSISERIGRLTLRMFCNVDHPHESYPMMSSLDAAEMRKLLPCIVTVCRRWNSGSDLDEHRLLCVRNIADACELIDTDPRLHFTSAQVELFQSYIDGFLLHYAFLAASASDSGRLLWNLVVKLHFVWHGGQQAAFLHPALQWNFTFEDIVGKASKLAHSCTHGLRKARIGQAFFNKCRSLLHIRWTRLA